MKISKRSVKACETAVCTDETAVAVDTAPIVDLFPCVDSQSVYSQAIDHIRSAIEVLGSIARDDSVARESIANLSVVLFDLKG